MIRREASEHGFPPGRLAIVSPCDTDARYSEKRGARAGSGYKVHLTETCHRRGQCDRRAAGRAEAPNLITNVATTAAAVPDAAMTEPVHDALGFRGTCCLASTPSVAGYTSLRTC